MMKYLLLVTVSVSLLTLVRRQSCQCHTPFARPRRNDDRHRSEEESADFSSSSLLALDEPSTTTTTTTAIPTSASCCRSTYGYGSTGPIGDHIGHYPGWAMVQTVKTNSPLDKFCCLSAMFGIAIDNTDLRMLTSWSDDNNVLARTNGVQMTKDDVTSRNQQQRTKKENQHIK